MIPLDAFSPDYQTARSRFRALIGRRGWHTESHPVTAPGCGPDELTIDVARVGAPSAEKLMILSSGLHGVEGFFGSAVQLAWLDSLPDSWEPPRDCAVLLLHALNPYGFACLRRGNENSVDLNRNFVAADGFGRLKEATAGPYGQLDRYLNPASPPGPIDWFPIILPWMLLRFGRPMLARVLPSGQYAFPKGLFYGGACIADSTRIVMSEMPRWLGSASLVLHFDFHTGLGDYGTYQLLTSDHLNPGRVQLAERIFGADRVKHDHEVAGGYHNHGDMGEWLSLRYTAMNYLYMCAEFGTYGSIRVVGSLRRENQTHYWGDPQSPQCAKIKGDLVEAFAPASPAWRWTVIRQSLHLIQTALNFCAKPEHPGSLSV